jgi:tRNA threonylcarbamoyladenosine dehydratase
MQATTFDHVRAFGGINRLFGAEALAQLSATTMTIVGVGGVGSWAVEALARSGVGRLRLIDMDHLAESNLNRQLPALMSTMGQSKIEAMAVRIADINPNCQVELIDAFVTMDSVAAHLPSDCGVVVDCIDAVRVKAAMAAHCLAQGHALLMCGAAGGKMDATRLRITDLALTTHDALLASVRSELRRRYQLPKTGRMKIRCVSSDEAVQAKASGGLACVGYGSLVSVTACMGMMAAGEAIRAALKL